MLLQFDLDTWLLVLSFGVPALIGLFLLGVASDRGDRLSFVSVLGSYAFLWITAGSFPMTVYLLRV